MVKVSLIIITHNRPHFLRRAVASALASGVDGLEVIVVDDGSTDDTPDTMKTLAKEVVCLRQANAGPSAARNTGAAASHGSYLAFLDDDDEWLPQGPPRLVAALDRYPALPFVAADARTGNPESGYTSLTRLRVGGESLTYLPGEELEPGLKYFDRSALFRETLRRNLLTTGAFLIRREVFERVGGYDSEVRLGEDWQFYLRVGAQYSAAFSEGPPVVSILAHAGNVSADAERMQRGFVTALARLLRNAPLTPEDRLHLEEALRRRLFGEAYRAFDSGDHAAARTFLREYRRRFGLNSRVGLLSVASRFPVPLVRKARRLWRNLSWR